MLTLNWYDTDLLAGHRGCCSVDSFPIHTLAIDRSIRVLGGCINRFDGSSLPPIADSITITTVTTATVATVCSMTTQFMPVSSDASHEHVRSRWVSVVPNQCRVVVGVPQPKLSCAS